LPHLLGHLVFYNQKYTNFGQTYHQSLISHLSKALSLSALDSLVIDEADLILSYGHDEDIRQIFGGGFLPKVYQSFLMSATMTDDVDTLKGLALRNPVRSTGFLVVILSN